MHKNIDLMQPPVFRLTGLDYRFPGAPTPLFHQLSAELPAGVTWLTGDEGCGKTTLLKILAGAEPAQQGRWQWLCDAHTTAPSPKDILPPCVAWHDLNDRTHDQQSPRQIWAELFATHSMLATFEPLIEGLSLREHLDKPLYQLSTGSRRKTWIAATLAQQARLTLLDQPFSALDRPSINFLLAHIRLAATATGRVWLVADHEAPAGVPLAHTWVLGRPGA